MFAFRVVALLLVLLFGSMASAASIQNINVRLNFLGHSYFNTTVLDESGNILFQDDLLEQANDVWGLPRLFDFTIGQTLRLTAGIDPDAPNAVMNCDLGGVNCAQDAILDTAPTDPLSIFYGGGNQPLGWFRGGLTSGSTLVFDLVNSFGQLFVADTQSGDLAGWFVWRAEFAVLEDLPQPAPIPLPASVLLLPAGLGGMVMLYRRKKRQLS